MNQAASLLSFAHNNNISSSNNTSIQKSNISNKNNKSLLLVQYCEGADHHIFLASLGHMALSSTATRQIVPTLVGNCQF
jgi:hypothetical protein